MSYKMRKSIKSVLTTQKAKRWKIFFYHLEQEFKIVLVLLGKVKQNLTGRVDIMFQNLVLSRLVSGLGLYSRVESTAAVSQMFQLSYENNKPLFNL